MAMMRLLAELVTPFAIRTGHQIALESAGGVDVVKRIQAGETFDFVVAGSDAIDRLITGSHLSSHSKVDLVRSGVAMAVRAGAPRPDIADEDACKRAIEAARTIGYSTGPSGVALANLFERWGIAGRIRERIVIAPPGVPVGSLVAAGEVELGLQQLSELIHVPGIDVIGPLPASIQIMTTFSGAIGARASRPDIAGALLAFVASPGTDQAKRRQGMEPARPEERATP